MIIASIIYAICVFTVILYYSRKIKNLKKKIPIETERVNTQSIPVNKFIVSGYYYTDAFDNTSSAIRRFSREVAENYWKCRRENFERQIYRATWDLLVTDERTEEDNKKALPIKVEFTNIELNKETVKATLTE